jgi:orotate phosphoribosyltransferase
VQSHTDHHLSREFHHELSQIALSCYCPERVIKPDGQERFGFFNLKRLYGSPQRLQRLIDILSTLITGDTLCAVDTGISPLVGALALHSRTPSIYLRSVPKHYYLSYGSTRDHNNPHIIGEYAPTGTRIQLFDDIIHSGDSLIRALDILNSAGLDVTSVLCIMSVRDNDSAIRRLHSAGVTAVTVLLQASDILADWPNRP